MCVGQVKNVQLKGQCNRSMTIRGGMPQTAREEFNQNKENSPQADSSSRNSVLSTLSVSKSFFDIKGEKPGC